MQSLDYEAVLRGLLDERSELDAAIRAIRPLALRHKQAQPPAEATDPGSFANMTRANAAYRLLSEVGHSLTPKEIVDQLLARGFQTTSLKPHESMRSALRRSSRFRKNSRGAWGLKEWLIDPAEENELRAHALEMIE